MSKVGDRVYFLSQHTPDIQNAMRGFGTIHSFDKDEIYNQVYVWDKRTDEYYIPEIIFKTPLYEAMKEEE